MKLSIIVPVFNEEENIPELYKELLAVLSKGDYLYEIICVDDGSRDKSGEVLAHLAEKDKNFKVIAFSRNFGQTAAMSAGIKAASGDIIIPIDADLQNDPVDIPLFLTKISEGYDVVSGWRKNRKDKVVSRKLPSKIANWLISWITGVRIHDFGCSIKAYRREIIQNINLYGEMHRFIPAYASWQGGRVTEIVVNHRARVHGQTKYGISRTFRVILDLIVIKFLSQYIDRPIHFFGGLGFISGFLGVLAGLYAVILRIAEGTSLSRTPLPILSAMFIIVGVQLVVMGVIAEMIMRSYYENQGKTPYNIKSKINF